jgi:hypothetical protein
LSESCQEETLMIRIEALPAGDRDCLWVECRHEV